MVSAGPYASLHLAPDRYPYQHPTTQFLQTGCPSCRPTNYTIPNINIKYQLSGTIFFQTQCKYRVSLNASYTVNTLHRQNRFGTDINTHWRMCDKEYLFTGVYYAHFMGLEYRYHEVLEKNPRKTWNYSWGILMHRESGRDCLKLQECQVNGTIRQFSQRHNTEFTPLELNTRCITRKYNSASVIICIALMPQKFCSKQAN